MLEKIGLPPKPSMRGGSWVIDASHCQGCSSQFTFLNRKHHCRRCGGLFCNGCTQQRMILRGQGDSTVRICDPCKKIEEAARFELRYGHKNRAAKGASKQVQKPEEEVLQQILGTDGKHESHADTISDLLRTASSSSSLSLTEEPSAQGRGGDFQIDIGSSTPEELRQQAVEEKKKHRILKGEGKTEKALQAFKRGKDLERQAGALEIALRKNRRMVSKSNLTTMVSNQRKEEHEESISQKKLPTQRGKEEKSDLAAELRELGWSDADLHDAEKKPANLSLEGELSNLLRETPQSSSVSRKSGSIDKSQVVALKKKALLLKREGKLAEAKEELKRAKVLEKQLEEQELLGEDEESDDELSALIRNMDDDKHDDLLSDDAPVAGMNFQNFSALEDDFTINDNFDVTDNDMNDPELAAALKSFGWTEEEHATDNLLEVNPVDREALQHQVISLKKEALSQKRAGNVAEAMSLLKKAKLLEKDLEAMPGDAQSFVPDDMPKSSTSHVSPERSQHQASHEENVSKLPVKSKLAIQRELLALKKKALALRREGRLEEADDELKKGKVLEEQLEEMENAPKRPPSKVGTKNLEMDHMHVGVSGALNLGDEGVEAEVTEQDMHDPALMSVLKNLGWNEDDAESANMKSANLSEVPSMVPRMSKTEIQRELLGLKRKALALRRQGKTEEADEELERARDLEKQLTDMEASSSSRYTAVESHDIWNSVPQDKHDALAATDGDSLLLHMGNKPETEEIVLANNDNIKSTGFSGGGPSKPCPNIAQLDGMEFFSNKGSAVSQSTVEKTKADNLYADRSTMPTAPIQSNPQIGVQEITGNESDAVPKLASPDQSTAHGADAQKAKVLAHKRKAVALKREGKLAEAREELRQAKLLEQSLEGSPPQFNAGTRAAPVSTTETISAMQESRSNQQAPKPMSSRDRFKTQQESLAHKRNAMKLRREGKMAESEAEFELAKALESQLEGAGGHGSSAATDVGMMGGMGDGVEDLFDPQLMSALKSIGWDDSEFGAQPAKKPDPRPTADGVGSSRGERTQLEEMIKAEKVKALSLKRGGRQAEALEALRSAKRLEKKLASLE